MQNGFGNQEEVTYFCLIIFVSFISLWLRALTYWAQSYKTFKRLTAECPQLIILLDIMLQSLFKSNKNGYGPVSWQQQG